MVGVAGKSQGCNTCRKRKVKCDQGRPTCGQCTKSKRECAGYQRNRYFKNLSALDHDALIVRKQPLNPITESSIIQFDEVDHRPERGLRDLTSKPTVPGPPENVYSSLSQLFGNFLSDYVPQGGKGKKNPPVSWLQTVQNTEHAGNNASLPLAITALSLVRLGRKHQSEELQNEGMAFYGQALEGLQAMLSSEDLIFEEQTLASCMTLSIFEVLETLDPNVRGWISHVQGLFQLFQLRGPGLHISESSHRLFLGFRPTGIIHALATRRSNYLGDEEWLTIPWQRIPKSDFHHLLDIMARMPALLERTDLAVKSNSILPSEMEYLVERNWGIERQLRTWYMNLVNSTSTSLRSESSSTTIIAASGVQPLLNPSISFPDFEIARMHLFYWTALLLIYNNLMSIPHISSPTHQNSHTHIRSELHTVAILIARSIPYLISPDAHTLGPQNVFFPLRNAMQAFLQLGEMREERWCRDIFEELDRRGFPFGKIVANVKWEDIPQFCT